MVITIAFYLTALVAIFATLMVITRLNAMHALLYLIISLLSLALIFFLLGAPFAAALEVLIYAGAIMVLFVFAVMLLNLGPQAVEREGRWLSPMMWWGPGLLAGALLLELIFVLSTSTHTLPYEPLVGPKAVGLSLYGPYLLGLELAGVLLLSGLVGAYHLGRRHFDERGGRA